MCDTIYVPARNTNKGIPLFAKNSDRDPNEAHYLVMYPHTSHQPSEMVQCTYIAIPQVSETNSVLLAKPFWIWGAEMGANEHGVTIGNEAVFTKVPYVKQNALTGMDLLRLALERGSSAYTALQVIIDLLEKYGQGGNCGYLHSFYYHNSFLIADPKDAWVLETAGNQWAAEHVTGIRTISNALTITNKWDLASSDLVDLAFDKGWCRNRAEFSFADCYSDLIFTTFSDGRGRQACSTMNFKDVEQGIHVRDLMQLLRTHRRGSPATWAPNKGLAGADICMHAGVGPIRINETTGSMVSELGRDEQLHWVTGTTAPCTGIFKPVYFHAGLPDQGVTPNGKYDPNSLWWQHERLHREVIKDYQRRIGTYQTERDLLEEFFISGSEKNLSASLVEKKQFSEECFKQARNSIQLWYDRIKNTPIQKGTGILYRNTRKRLDRLANLPD